MTRWRKYAVAAFGVALLILMVADPAAAGCVFHDMRHC